MVFAILYIPTDCSEYSEILGLFNQKEEAVNYLIKMANYRERNGNLTQYMKPTNDYDSINHIKDVIDKNNELIDEDDIFRLQEIKIMN